MAKKLKIKPKALKKAGNGDKVNTLKGGKYWEHRDPEKDTNLENALEYIPGVGNLLSVNDWMTGVQNLYENPNKQTLKNAALETLGLIPFGNLVGKAGKTQRAGWFLDSAFNAASDENLNKPKTGGWLDIYKNGGELQQNELDMATKKKLSKSGKVLTLNGRKVSKAQKEFFDYMCKHGYASGGMLPQDTNQQGQEQMQQVMQMVMQALQQGQDPQQIVQTLIQQGVPQEIAAQAVQQVMAQSQGQEQQPEMNHGGKLPIMQNTGMVWNSPITDSLDYTKAPQPGLQLQNADESQNTFYDPNQSGQLPLAPDLNTQTPIQTNPTNVVNKPALKSRFSNSPFYDIRQGQNNLYESQDFRQQASETSDPTLQKQFNNAATNDEVGAAGHFLKFGIGAVREGLLGFSTLNKNIQVKKDEQEKRLLNNSLRAEITKPTRGDSALGGGTNPGYYKHGGDLPMYEDGGLANVIYERGETVSRPSGEVEHITYGDEHSDPSGGIKAFEEPGTVIHSKSLGTTVGDFVNYAQKFPDAKFIISKVMDKYKNPEKEVSYSDIAKLFDTKKLTKEIGLISKKLDKEKDKSADANNTTITAKTAQLNTKTLSVKKAETEQKIAENTLATGAQGPIFNMAEDLKKTGAYGKEIKNEAKKAKFGRLILPKAEYGKLAPGIPFMKDGDIVSDKFNKFINKGDKWYYFNDNKLGEEVPSTYRPNGADDYGAGQNALSNFIKMNTNVSPETQAIYTENAAEAAKKYGAPEVTTSTSTPITTGVQTLPGTGNYSTSEGGTHFAPAAVTNFKNLMWLGDKGDPRAEQIAAGLPKGFNASPFKDNAYAGIKGLFDLGFDPSAYGKSWENFGADETQDFLYNADKKQGFKNLKLIFNHYKDTNQGELKGLKGKQWEELNDNEVKDFFNDNKYGVRTYLAQSLLSPAQQAQVAKGETPANVKSSDVEKFNANLPKGSLRRKNIYQETLHPAQIAAPLMDLFAAKQAVPYIEDQGAKDALAMNTKQRYTDIQPQLNRISRDLLARTRNGVQNPAINAQYASNAYEAANQVYGQKYNADAQIEQNYNQQQLQLRQQAGTNKAKALEELSTRVATRDWKDYAMKRNAVGEIGNKYTQNLAENRSAALYQDMFQNYGLNPNFTTSFVGGNPLSVNPLFNTPPSVTKETEKEKARAYYKALYDEDPTVTVKKYGGKVKLPKKKLKSKQLK